MCADEEEDESVEDAEEDGGGQVHPTLTMLHRHWGQAYTLDWKGGMGIAGIEGGERRRKMLEKFRF